MPKFSNRSQERLNTCHRDLRKLFNEVIKHYDCTILCGHRNKEDQDKAYNEGRSKVEYPDSNHNQVPSLAVDCVPYPIDWDDKERFHEFAGFVLGTADQLGIKVRWGGHFTSFFDGPHFELIE